MDGPRILLGLLIAAAGSTLGCASSHWSSDRAPDAWPAVASQPGAAETGLGSSAAPGSPAPAANGQADSQALLDVMAEVRRLGALDPTAEAQLLENLRQTPPELWPLVVEQFRAALSYRQRAERDDTAPPQLATSPGAPPALPAAGPAAERPAADALASTAPAGKAVAAKIEPPGPTLTAAPVEADPRPLPQVEELQPRPADDRVTPASHDQEQADQWRRHLDEAIRSLQSEVSPSPGSSDEIAQHARLRMLYLLNGRRDQALQPIPAVASGTQDFWSNEIYGLAALLDGASGTAPSRLAAEAQRPLDAAVTRLGESCPLLLRNLAFVTEVQSYGVFKRFDKYEFTPGQKLLLYAEVDNFKSTETEKGFHTALKSSYQIFEPGGRRVAEHEFNANEEYCRNRRRDFFIGYEFFLPKQIYPGKHVLKLTVEDVESGKVGESSIEFTVLATDQ